VTKLGDKDVQGERAAVDPAPHAPEVLLEVVQIHGGISFCITDMRAYCACALFIWKEGGCQRPQE